jgi:hypothetical protein
LVKSSDLLANRLTKTSDLLRDQLFKSAEILADCLEQTSDVLSYQLVKTSELLANQLAKSSDLLEEQLSKSSARLTDILTEMCSRSRLAKTVANAAAKTLDYATSIMTQGYAKASQLMAEVHIQVVDAIDRVAIFLEPAYLRVCAYFARRPISDQWKEGQYMWIATKFVVCGYLFNLYCEKSGLKAWWQGRRC